MRSIRPSLTNELRASTWNIPTMVWGPPGIGKSQIAINLQRPQRKTI